MNVVGIGTINQEKACKEHSLKQSHFFCNLLEGNHGYDVSEYH